MTLNERRFKTECFTSSFVMAPASNFNSDVYRVYLISLYTYIFKVETAATGRTRLATQ